MGLKDVLSMLNKINDLRKNIIIYNFYLIFIYTILQLKRFFSIEKLLCKLKFFFAVFFFSENELK